MNTRTEEEISCRICRDEVGPFVAPCLCSGSIAYVHNPCLETWVQTRNSMVCEVCKEEYSRSETCLRPFSEWSAPSPLSHSIDDTIDFYCAIMWAIFMLRVAYVSCTSGLGAVPCLVGEVLGGGTVYALWWTSFWLNALYYGIVSSLIVERWITINTHFVFTSKWSNRRSHSPALRTARESSSALSSRLVKAK